MNAGNTRLPIIAVSRCLLGEPVRYDGRDKEAPELIAAIRPHCTILPVCPEVEAGLPVPRPPIQLIVDSHGNYHLMGRDDPDLDVTQPLHQFASHFCHAAQKLSAAILQNRSPNCGVADTPIYNSAGIQQSTGDGFFSAFLKNSYPELPITTPQQLDSSEEINLFIQRATAYNGS